MGKVIDREWQFFDRLFVIRRVENSKSGKSRWLCICDCDRHVIVSGDSLSRSKRMSCGCHKENSESKYSHTKLYGIWDSIKSRCCNPNVKGYKTYGGRGISVCDEWRGSFLAFRDWALSNGYQEGLQIDRIDNDEGYSPSNCRFVTRKEQMRNKRNNIYFDGKLLIEIAEMTGIAYKTLHGRLKRNPGISYSQLVRPSSRNVRPNTIKAK